MKNILVLLFLVLIASINLEAQNKTSYDVIVTGDEVLKEYRAKAADTISTNAQTFTYTFFNKGQAATKESFTNRWQIALDSVSGTADTIAVSFERRLSIFSAWTTDSTMNFYGTVSDTTLIYLDTTAYPDPYRRVKVTYGSGFKIKIDWLAAVFLIE